MTLNDTPIFCDLHPNERELWLNRATRRAIPAGEVLCYQGDAAETVRVLVVGRCAARRDGHPVRDRAAPALLDAAAVLGGLPHSLTLTAATDCELLSWPVRELWTAETFQAAARRWLARELLAARARRDALAAPLHYQDAAAQVRPGPFMFEDVTLVFAFCDMERDALRDRLPEGARTFRRPGRRRDAVLLALADFPTAYPEDAPDARFGYTETTVFLPVRIGARLGLYVPFIYPSAWEPILLGREIYGFPKRLGETTLAARAASLAVDGAEQCALTWAAQEPTGEPRLVRALMDWLGLEGWSLALAFRAGDVLRQTMQLPPFRRVSVYNHKRIPAVESTESAPAWAVDQLTHALFGVLHWHQIARLTDPVLAVTAGPLAGAGLRLREAFRTQLDMRLSAGRVARDYGNE